MKKTWFKWCITTFAIAGVLSSSFFIYDASLAKSGESLAKRANENLSDKKHEYIKVVQEDGSYEEHWRDLKNLQERHDTYTKDGELVNRIIVTEKGKRVYVIGNDNGTLEASTWVLPEKVANQNKKILQISLLEETKDRLKNGSWKKIGKEKMKGKDVEVIESQANGLTEDMYVDLETGLPVKKDTFKGSNKIRTEYYETIDGEEDIYEVDSNLDIKEMPNDMKDIHDEAKG